MVSVGATSASLPRWSGRTTEPASTCTDRPPSLSISVDDTPESPGAWISASTWSPSHTVRRTTFWQLMAQ